jgi:hypothetical protein
MQLVSCQNLFEINGNHRNNIPIIDMSIADVIMLVATVISWCAFVGLVPPRSSKLRLAYLKTEPR